MTASRRRVVISGAGIVSAAGCDVRRAWDRLVAGESAVSRIRGFDPSSFPSQIGGEVDLLEMADPDRLHPPDPAVRVPWETFGRIAWFAARATADAVVDAGLMLDAASRARTGLVMAAGVNSWDHHELFTACAAAAEHGGFDWQALARCLLSGLQPHADARWTPGSIAALLARELGIAGPVSAVMTACAGGTQAVGDAARWIRTGRADVVIAGASDTSLSPLGLASFCLLGALSRRNDRPALASRPFDAERDGFVLGEGAGVVVLEELEHARRRGARVMAEVGGFGSSCDAYRVTDPHPAGAGAILAMQRALADAGLTPADIDYINAHGTSTPANDRIESMAIQRVFGDHAARLAISSTKSMLGHATVAAGAIEAVVTAMTLSEQTIHPTINLHSPDPACALDYVPHVARRARIRAALSNSFAFGGQSACLVLTRAEA